MEIPVVVGQKSFSLRTSWCFRVLEKAMTKGSFKSEINRACSSENRAFPFGHKGQSP